MWKRPGQAWTHGMVGQLFRPCLDSSATNNRESRPNPIPARSLDPVSCAQGRPIELSKESWLEIASIGDGAEWKMLALA